MLDRDGEKIGKIEEIFLVEETGRPEWALVKIGRLKAHTTLVPLTRANPVDDGVKIPFGREVVSEAPEVGAGDDPSEQQVNALYRHYGIDPAEHTDGGGASNGVNRVKEDATTLVGQEMRLAKAEMGEKAKEIGIGAGVAGGAGYVAYLASIAFMLTLIFALAEGCRHGPRP